MFSFLGEAAEHPEQVVCHLTHTTERTHDIIRGALDRFARSERLMAKREDCMYISGDFLLASRKSPKQGPVRPMPHYPLQTRVEIATLQRDHHLEARMGITQAQRAAVRFGDLTAEIEP